MSNTTQDEDPINDKPMPLIEHLMELRQRLLWSVGAFLIAFALCYYFSTQIYGFLAQPLANVLIGQGGGDRRMIFTALYEAFFTYLKVAFFGAVFFSFPIWATQLWLFIAPGLYRSEKRTIMPFLIASPFLFLLGAALVYYVMLPFVMWFSLSQQIIGEGVAAELLPKVSDYLNLVTALILAFGLCFQLPVVMTLLGLAGLINSKLMAQSRRYAIVAVVVVAAVVTPPDPISQLMLALPMVLLYEVSIWCVRIIELRRKKADADEGLAA